MTQGRDGDPSGGQAAPGRDGGDGGDDAVTPEELGRRIDAGERVSVLDVRNRDEFEAWQIEGVDLTNVPYMKFAAAKARGDADELVEEVDEPMVVVCPRGEASAEVAETLREAGVEAYNLAGGMRGWARVYETREVDADAGGATVVQYRRPSSGCLAYLVAAGGEALVVDPLRAFADRYVEDARECGLDLRYVLDTHVHADHVSGLREVADRADAEPVMSEGAVARGVTYEVTTVADGDELAVGDVPVEVVATPGHTSGAISLSVGDVLLTGDTAFVEAVPRPDLEHGVQGTPDGASGECNDPRAEDEETADAARELHRSLTERLARFGDDAVIAPGHYSARTEPAEDGTYTARLGDVRERLPAFSQDREAFAERVLDSLGRRPANFEEILAINLGRETVDDGDALELELGPNNCAAAPAD